MNHLQLPVYKKITEDSKAMQAVQVLLDLGYNPAQVSRAMQVMKSLSNPAKETVFHRMFLGTDSPERWENY